MREEEGGEVNGSVHMDSQVLGLLLLVPVGADVAAALGSGAGAELWAKNQEHSLHHPAPPLSQAPAHTHTHRSHTAFTQTHTLRLANGSPSRSSKQWRGQ